MRSVSVIFALLIPAVVISSDLPDPIQEMLDSRTAGESCGAEAATIAPGKISYYQNGVFCYNPQKIEGGMRCLGTCESRSSQVFSGLDYYVRRFDCGRCCVPHETVFIPINTKCADGTERAKEISVIESCSCQPCPFFKA